MRVTTIYAGSAAATAKYYTQYLTQAVGEEPGCWLGAQAEGLGLSGQVSTEVARACVVGVRPAYRARRSGRPLDRSFPDERQGREGSRRFRCDVSAPKSLVVWWALTGDPGLAASRRRRACRCRRFGAVRGDDPGAGQRAAPASRHARVDGGGVPPDDVAGRRSAGAHPRRHLGQGPDRRRPVVGVGRPVLKRHQRMLGGLYQSVLRAELTHRYGVAWRRSSTARPRSPASRRSCWSGSPNAPSRSTPALAGKVDEFRRAGGSGPDPLGTRRARAGGVGRHPSPQDRQRCRRSADTVGRPKPPSSAWTPDSLVASITRRCAASGGRAGGDGRGGHRAAVGGVVDVAPRRCPARDLRPVRPVAGVGESGGRPISNAPCDRVIDALRRSRPARVIVARRASDGRSVWLEPVADHFTSDAILAEEEHMLAWAMDAQADDPRPVDRRSPGRLDVLQADAAAAVAGADRLVVVVGPAGAGKTTMLGRAVDDLDAMGPARVRRGPDGQGGPCPGTRDRRGRRHRRQAAPRMGPDRPAPPDVYRLPAGTTLIVDEAGMIGTAALHRLVELADRSDWRLALVGDPRQLQAVGRGGLFAELCATGRHDRTRPPPPLHQAVGSGRLPAAATRQPARPRRLRGPRPDRRRPVRRPSRRSSPPWLRPSHAAGGTIGDHRRHQRPRRRHQRRHPAAPPRPSASSTRTARSRSPAASVPTPATSSPPAATTASCTPATGSIGPQPRPVDRDRYLRTTGRSPCPTAPDTAPSPCPPDYAREHVRLGYAATEHGNQSDTVDVGITLATTATTARASTSAPPAGDRRTASTSSPTPTTSTKPATSSKRCSPTTAPTSPPSPNAGNSPDQDRQPALQPKCTIPDWFTDLRADAASRVDRREPTPWSSSEAKRAQLQQAINDATQRLAVAKHACEPYDVHRRRRPRSSRRRRRRPDRPPMSALPSPALLHRRARRADLAATNDDPGAPNRNLPTPINKPTPPTGNEPGHNETSPRPVTPSARTTFWTAGATTLNDSTTPESESTPSTPGNNGPKDTRSTATNSLTPLQRSTDSPDAAIDGTLALANVVRQWAHHNNVDIEPQRAQGIDRSELGIELGF